MSKKLQPFRELQSSSLVSINWKKKQNDKILIERDRFSGQRSLVCCSPWGGKESDVT